MRFMLMTKPGRNYEAGVPPSPELMAAIGKLTDEMTKAGVLVDTGGLMPSAKGARMSLTGGKLNVTDGPFTEAKEIIGGYAIVQVGSKQEALDLAKRFMEIHAEVLGPSYEGESEIRQMYDPSDFEYACK
jgi:hypothetical protein